MHLNRSRQKEDYIFNTESSRVIGCNRKLCARDVRVCARSSEIRWWNVVDWFASGHFKGSRANDIVLGRHMQEDVGSSSIDRSACC
jgi:hypothetical protein